MAVLAKAAAGAEREQREGGAEEADMKDARRPQWYVTRSLTRIRQW